MQHTQSKYDFIDIVRTIAAFAVVISHIQQIVIDRPLSAGIVNRVLSLATTQGENAVVVFFVISGFWIIRSVTRSAEAFSWGDYMLARLSRLWVVLLPALVLGGAIDFIGDRYFPSALYNGIQGAVSITRPVSQSLDPLTFLGNVIFLQGWLVKTFGSNGALWSLTCEFWYYVYFPALWLAWKSKKIHLIVPTLALLAVIPGLHLFGIWLLGGVVYYFAERKALSLKISSLHVFGSLIIFVISLGVANLLDEHKIIANSLVGISFALALYCALAAKLNVAKVLVPVARFGASSSYSLYAVHFPLIVFVLNFIVPEHRMAASWSSWLLVFGVPVLAGLYGYVFSMTTEANTEKVKAFIKGRWLGLNKSTS
ncbi:acyltransferase [Asticcacaulis sp. 201]|uniref:acyltransferase family protein n=1 Tax=Asticcacaulis sp. 201 TaxID=3028787 RepID=UPI002916DD63|nr:acyltransferase [Asticcacaulis sp. 201]MDV6329888.1 acyltransferase [Asticcacaulis sp. 201]